MKINENKMSKARKKKCLTQAQLAQIVAVSTNYIALIERGQRRPSLKALSKIAYALDVSQNFLLDNDLKADLKDLSSKYDLSEILKGLQDLIKLARQN
jgi:transcriptional regulator with XRE-family HTH domain